MKKYLAIFLLFFCLTVHAQENGFKAVLVYGNVWSSEKSSSGWKAIEPGTMLKEEDQIKIGQDAYLGLISWRGNAIEFKTPGVYSLVNFLNLVSNTPPFPDPIVSLLDSISKDLSGDNLYLEKPGYKYKKSEIAGPISCNTDIHVLLDRSNIIYNDTLYLKWKSSSQHKNDYLIVLKNIFDDSLRSYLFQDSMAVIPVNDIKESSVVVELSAAGERNTATSFNFRKLSKENVLKTTAEMNVLKSVIGNRAPAFNTLLLAYYFKKRNMNMYFYHYLYLAAGKAKDVKLYEKLRSMYAGYR